MTFDLAAVEAPFRMQPGLRRIAPNEPQLTLNGPDTDVLRAKLAVLSAHPHQALGVVDGFDPGPALRALGEHASREHPHAWRADAPDRVEAPQLGWSVERDQPRGSGPAAIGACLRALPAQWRVAGLLSLAFAEDFAILDAATGGIPWLAVCLPSHWAPEDKLGRHFTEVHAPVADNAALLAAAPALTALVTGPGRWQRQVWTLTPAAGYDAHPRRVPATPWPLDLEPAALAARTWLRSERQTFIPVPGAGQAVFTIRVELQPLTAAVATPADAARLHAALASMSPAVLAYRRLAEVQAPLLEWLSARAVRSGA